MYNGDIYLRGYFIMNEQLKGLTQEEVDERIKKYGFNELQTKGKSAFLRCYSDFGDLFLG